MFDAYIQVILLSYPFAEGFALHGYRADVESTSAKELFGQVNFSKAYCQLCS